MTPLPTVYFLLDDTGSMRGSVETVNHAMQNIFKLNGKVANIRGATFGGRYNGFTDPNYPPQILATAGSTDLFGSTIDFLSNLNAKHSPGDKILCIVVTDGGDTTARATPKQVKEEVTIAEDYNRWEFLFVGTNQNANDVGKMMGVKPGKSLSFANSNQGFQAMLEACTRIITEWAGGHLRHEDRFFSNEDQEHQRSLGARV